MIKLKKWLDNYKARSSVYHLLGLQNWKAQATKEAGLQASEILQQVNTKLIPFLHGLLLQQTVAEQTELATRLPHAVNPSELMMSMFGFALSKKQSLIPQAGNGIFVDNGLVTKGSIVGIYAGLIYQPGDLIFFQSISNPFIFRCHDGVLVDGHHKGLSRRLYLGCARRDRVGRYALCDDSWLQSDYSRWRNPLACGQFINDSRGDSILQNVDYFEVDIEPALVPLAVRQFLPNVRWRVPEDDAPPLRIVLIVALRDIRRDEELYSSYFTLVHSQKHP